MIGSIVTLEAELIAQSEEVETLEEEIWGESSSKESRRSIFCRSTSTFFWHKYSFDGDSFKLQRNSKTMLRGGDRTISDGEKSVIAFCYFLAQCHLRVESNEEYKKLFLVFDDPVTSMSYDYIYSIIQCLKLLRISEEGKIQFNLQSNLYKPRMLILKHNRLFLQHC